MERLPGTGNLRLTLTAGQAVRVGDSLRFSIIDFDERTSRSGNPYTVALVSVEAPRGVYTIRRESLKGGL
jgi:hypothetical protein